MTNGIYFDLNRNDTSDSSSTCSQVSQHSIVEDQQTQSSSSSYSALIAKAIAALKKFQRPGTNQKDSRDDKKDYELSGTNSSAFMQPTSPSKGENMENQDLMIFNYKEVWTATRNFHPDAYMGEDGLGHVFKGWIEQNTSTGTKSGRRVAVSVSVLNVEVPEVLCSWLTEVDYLGRLYHPNLVRLYGCCLTDKRGFLVYEFMPQGSLEDLLFRGNSSHLFCWSMRLKVALGTAKGLSFLHGDDINVIYGDVKSCSILVDLDYNAKIYDFWLAKDCPSDGMSNVSTEIKGTYGYAAPEYIASGNLSAKCDVYGFGVVLLELLSGRRVIDTTQPSKEHNLVNWAKPRMTSSRISTVLDKDIDGLYFRKNILKAGKLALKCVDNDPNLRPNMDQVVTTLEQLQQI